LYKEFIIFLGTENLQKTSDFYENILEMPLYKDQKGICMIFTVNAQSKIGFCKHMPIIYKDKSPIITLVVDNVDEVYKKLLENKIEIEDRPKVNPTFNIYHFFFKDPNGYTIEVQKFLE
jgi:catechol 2,3-dioxygenase-like lactoylglutathione lyase family enzyme